MKSAIGPKRSRKITSGIAGRTPEVMRGEARVTLDRVLKEINRRLGNAVLRKDMKLSELVAAAEVCLRYGVGIPRVNPNDLSDEQIIRLLNADAA